MIKQRIIHIVIFWLLFFTTSQAGIVERIIHAGDTPLASTCTVIQTGPLQLRVNACVWKTTGRARIIQKTKVKNLNARVASGDVQMMLDGKRVRGWLKNKDGSFVGKSKTYVLTSTIINWPADGVRYVVYMVEGPGNTMQALFMFADLPRPSGFIDYLIFPVAIPVGTIDLDVIDFEVFIVLPGFPVPVAEDDFIIRRR